MFRELCVSHQIMKHVLKNATNIFQLKYVMNLSVDTSISLPIHGNIIFLQPRKIVFTNFIATKIQY